LFAGVGTAKKVLQNYQNNLTDILFNSSNAHNARDIANMENDIANSDYNNKEDAA
jgi:predicted  nucleic acid-binding Zn-ribbon protein